MVEHSPYFCHTFPFQKDIETELRFPHRIFVRPVGGDIGGTIGQNVFGGLIDEVNFMEIVENSKKSVDQGTYDQASVLYDSIARRRKSRFMKQGKLPGLLCLVSSKNYPGQFTDRKMEEAKTDPTIYVYDKRSWDIAPEGTFIGEWFQVFIGDETRQPFIIDADKVEAVRMLEKDLVMDIPVEYRVEFQNDIMGALRDIAGVSTLARYPFFHDAVAITDCMDREISIFSRDEVDFKYSQLGIFYRQFKNPDEPRWVHIDLSKTGDSTGFAVGYCSGFREMDRGDGGTDGHFKNWIQAVRAHDKTLLNGPVETAHLSSGLAHLGNIAYRMGRVLTFDPASEKFVNDPDADKLLTRNYRAPYIVPENV